ncbi:MAG: GAF domain-containing protein, partial [Anaerolineae bacterium]|nr:GAF domain-containing protein [Anaerolineae bacterium]
TGSLEIENIIQGVSDGLQRLIPYTRMMVALVQEDSDYFEVIQVGFQGVSKVQIEAGDPLPVEGTVTGEVFAAQEGRVVFMAEEDEPPVHADLRLWQQSQERTTMLVPMLVGGTVIGVLRLGSELARAYGFHEENMAFVQRMVNLAAVAVQNARLYQQTAERERFSAALVRLNSVLNATLDLGATLESIGREAVAILDVQGAYTWQLDAATNELVGLSAVGPGRDSFAGLRIPVDDDSVLAARVLAAQEPLFINDVSTAQEVRLVLADYADAYAIMGVPLLREGQALGVLSLVKIGTQESFTAGSVQRAAVFATQASIALENARLYQETRELQHHTAERAEQLAAITDISSRLTATLEPDDVIELVLDYLGAVLPYEGVTLWLRDGGDLRIAAARGYDGNAAELVGLEVAIEDSPLFQEMAERRQTLNIPDVLGDPRFPGSEQRPTRNWLGAPLISKGEIIGLLALDKAEPGYYTDNSAQLALAFANQAAVALENAQLFAEALRRTGTLTEQTQRLGLLNRVATKLAQSLDVENIFEVALIESVGALEVRTARAVMFDVQQQVGSVIVEYPRGDAPPTDTIRLDSNPAVDYVRRTLQPLVVEDARHDPLLQSWRAEMEARGIEAVAIVPLSVGGQVIGALILEGYDPETDFTAEQIELVQTIASQAAIAVQNANLFEQSVIRTRELETLFDASQATALSLDLGEVIHSVSQQMLHALEADACAVMLWDEVEQNLIVRADVTRADNDEHSVPAGTTYALADYPARLVVLEGRKERTLQREDDDLDPHEQAEMAALGSATRMLVPLVVREQSIGLIRIDIFMPYRTLGLSDQRIARTLAGQAATFIENARLNAETEAQVQEAFVLNDISRAMSAVVTMDGVMPIVRDRIPALSEAEWLYFALYDAGQESFSFPVVVRKGEPFEFSADASGGDEFSWIVRFRRPLLLVGDDLVEVRQNLGIEPVLPDILSFLGVPVLFGDEIIGVLALGDDDNSRAFGLNDQRILSTVAGQLAVTIQNARLYEQLEARVRARTEEVRAERDRLNTLYNITAELSATLDMDRVLERALDLLASAVGAEQGDIMLIDHQQDMLYFRAEMGRGRVVGVGMASERRGLNIHEGLAGWVIQNRQSIVIDDVQHDPRWLQIQPEDRVPRSALAVLLETSDEILGVMMLYSGQAGVFNDEHLRLVMAAARQLSTAINNAELYFFIREQAERLGDLLREQQIESSKSTAILEGVADGVMVADEMGDISLFNSTAERILGVDRRTVIGQPFRSLSGLYGGGGRRWTQAIEEWMQDPSQIRPGEYVSETLDLGEKTVNVSLSPVHMGDQFLGTVSVFRDITREVEVDRMKTEFISNVSHELRTPMTSIKGYADLLLLGAAGEISERQQGFLSTIKANADRLSNLVNDLLNISRIDAGRVELKFQPLDLGSLTRTVLANLGGRVELAAKAITIEEEITSGLPITFGDGDRLAQVITNLVDNAFQYTPEGGKITVHLEYQEPEHAFLLSVADTGIGIPKRLHDRIFERFFRNDEQALVMETPGTGLGLAIVKELVEMHGGDIWFASQEGVGTTFFIKLPHYTEAPPMDTPA